MELLQDILDSNYQNMKRTLLVTVSPYLGKYIDKLNYFDLPKFDNEKN